MRQRTNRLPIAVLLIGIPLFLQLTSPVSLAGEVRLLTGLNFGTIAMHPGGDTVIIPAQNGPATPQATRSHITGGHSGEILISSETATSVTILYPPSITLSDDSHKVIVNEITKYSEPGFFNLLGSGDSKEISVGGKLKVEGNENSGTYDFSMNIQITFN